MLVEHANCAVAKTNEAQHQILVALMYALLGLLLRGLEAARQR